MQCWIMFGSDETEENKVFGVCIGRIAELPNFRQYEIVICTGKRREFWEDQLVREITEFAKHNNPNIEKIYLNEVKDVKMGKDASMNISKLKKILND